MRNPLRHVRVLTLLAAIGMTAGTFPGPAGTPDLALAAEKARPEDAPKVLKASMDAFWEQDYTTAEQLARQVAATPGTGKGDLIEAQKTLACIYEIQRQQMAAIKSIMTMLKIDPTARFSLEESYPPTVISRFWSVRDSLFAGTTDLKTIAVGDFENNSVYTGKFGNYDFGALSRALPHLVTRDLAQAGDLKVVDRQRTSEILKELAISTSGFADPKMAVKAGKLLGAHAYIFGQYMLLSASTVRIDMRVVKTATGEVLDARSITADFSGKPEKFFELEKQLVTELMTTLKTAGAGIEGDAVGQANAYLKKKGDGISGRKGYVDGLFLTAEALKAEESKDYKGALNAWKKVLAADPANELAAVRIKVLEPLTGRG